MNLNETTKVKVERDIYVTAFIDSFSIYENIQVSRDHIHIILKFNISSNQIITDRKNLY